jgi:ABC-type lipoprotein release transport system permease subunit
VAPVKGRTRLPRTEVPPHINEYAERSLKLYTLTPKRLAVDMEVEVQETEQELGPIATVTPAASRHQNRFTVTRESSTTMSSLEESAAIKNLQYASQVHETSLHKLETCRATLAEIMTDARNECKL